MDPKNSALALTTNDMFGDVVPELGCELAELPAFQEEAERLMAELGFRVDYSFSKTDDDQEEEDRGHLLQFFVAKIFLAGELHARLSTGHLHSEVF